MKLAYLKAKCKDSGLLASNPGQI